MAELSIEELQILIQHGGNTQVIQLPTQHKDGQPTHPWHRCVQIRLQSGGGTPFGEEVLVFEEVWDGSVINWQAYVPLNVLKKFSKLVEILVDTYKEHTS